MGRAASSVARRRADALPAFGMKFWLDASRIAGLNDADPVGTWSDRSGNANNATQNTAANKPLYKTAILNGRPVVRGDGVNDRLDTGSFAWGSSDVSLFAVWAYNAGGFALDQNFIMYGNGSAPTWYALTDVDDSTAPHGYRIGMALSGAQFPRIAPTSDNLATNEFTITSAVWSSASGGSLWDKGALQGSSAVHSEAFGTKALRLFGTNGLPLDIAEVILYNRALDAGERKQVERYLGRKYGITVS